MKKLFLVLPIILLFSSCQLDDSSINSSSTIKDGSILLKFEPNSIPAGIVNVKATLNRQGFTTITGDLNILSDSTAEISIQYLASGIWHLIVQAKDSLNVVRFSGEADVNILENQVTQVNLTLFPTGTGTGGIHIVVHWGTPNQEQWQDYHSNPILLSSNSFYDYAGVSQCKIIFDNDKYRMYYVGLRDNGVGNILYAESQDGIMWIRPQSQPVLTPGDSIAWDTRGVGPDAIIKDGNVFKLYYRGTNYAGVSHVGLATSSDGINFVKHPTPVLYSIQGSENNIGSHSLVKVNGVYYLYYAANSGSPATLKIYLATSMDGINWTRYSGNPILVKTQAWEGTGITYASVIYDNNQFKMIYQMYAYKDTAFGSAVSNDGKNWTKLNTNPVFTAKRTFNYWASGIDYPFLMKAGNEYRLYYSGIKNSPNYRIGFARRFSL